MVTHSYEVAGLAPFTKRSNKVWQQPPPTRLEAGTRIPARPSSQSVHVIAPGFFVAALVAADISAWW